MNEPVSRHPGPPSPPPPDPGVTRHKRSSAIGDARAFRDLVVARELDPPRDRSRLGGSKPRGDEREPAPEPFGSGGGVHLSHAIASTPSGADGTRSTPRAEADAMIERVVESLRLGRIGPDDQRVRMRLSLGRGSVDVELVHDGSGISATLRSADARLASSLHARLQREFDAAGIGDSAIEVVD